MQNLIYVNWSNGAIIMTVVFGLVILGLIYAVMSMMNKGKKKKTKRADSTYSLMFERI
jgi:cell division protein FtsX